MTRRELFSIVAIPILPNRQPETLSFVIPIFNIIEERFTSHTIAQVLLADTATCRNYRRAFGQPLEERYPEYKSLKLWAESKRLS